MDRDFRKGYLEIDFLTEPFDSPLPLLRDSVRVFFSNLPFLAAATLVIYRNSSGGQCRYGSREGAAA